MKNLFNFFIGTSILLLIAPAFLIFSNEIGYVITGILYIVFLIVVYNSKIGKETINKIKSLINVE